MTAWSHFWVWSLNKCGFSLGLRSAHLTEENVLSYLHPSSVPNAREDAVRAHLVRCESCTRDVEALEGFLANLSKVTEAGTSERISAHRLEKQKNRILNRIRRAVEPGHRGSVLRFPALTRPAFLTVRRVGPWLSAAATAGLLLGVAVGQWMHLHPEPTATTSRLSEATRTVTTASPIANQRTALIELPLAMTSTSEDGFLDELDQILSNPSILELTPLDEITPRIREATIYRW